MQYKFVMYLHKYFDIFPYSSLPTETNPDLSSKPKHTNKWRKAAGKAKQGRKTFLGKMRANSLIVLSGEDNLYVHSSKSQSMKIFNKEKKGTSGWTKHVWSTFIDRGFSDDATETEEK